MNPFELKNPKFLYFVYQNGKLDFISVVKKDALEMARNPETGATENFEVQRWTLTVKNSYKFDEAVKNDN